MHPKVIFLDFDGTICVSRFWGHWAKDDARSGVNRLIQELFFQTKADTLKQWMRGEHTAEDIVRIISTDIDFSADELLIGLKESCEQMKLLNPKILPLVKLLRLNGIKVVIATDNMDTFQRWTVPALNLDKHFDDILDSYSLNALKNDKDSKGRSKFFGEYFERKQLDPNETVLIDDGVHNSAIRDFGMQFIQVTAASPVESILASLNKS